LPLAQVTLTLPVGLAMPATLTVTRSLARVLRFTLDLASFVLTFALAFVTRTELAADVDRETVVEPGRKTAENEWVPTASLRDNANRALPSDVTVTVPSTVVPRRNCTRPAVEPPAAAVTVAVRTAGALAA